MPPLSAEQIFNPAYDNKIYRKYSKNTIEAKVQNKLFLQKELGLEEDKKKPLFWITCELTDKNGAAILEKTIAPILDLDLQIVVLWVGSEHYQQLFADLEEKYPEKLRVLPNNEISKRKIYAAANLALIFKNTTSNAIELKNALAYGVIPIAYPDPLLKEYDQIKETGQAFLFQEGNPWSFFAAIIRVLENYKFPYDWQNLELSAMNTLE